jgi:hypothetical protein
LFIKNVSGCNTGIKPSKMALSLAVIENGSYGCSKIEAMKSRYNDNGMTMPKNTTWNTAVLWAKDIKWMFWVNEIHEILS